MGGLLCCRSDYVRLETIPAAKRGEYATVYCIMCNQASPHALRRPCGWIPIVYYGGYICDECPMFIRQHKG